MNSKRKQSFVERLRRNGKKNLVISVVILIEILMLLTVATFSWVETVSSIKIATRNSDNQEDPLLVDSYVFTEAMIGEGKGTIDLAKYFKQAGDMHFAPASSADGETMFFPKVTGTNTAKYEGSPNSTVANSFRKGDSSDKNTAYMSISFKLRADVNADFFFTQVPTITLASYTQGGNYEIGPNIRVSVTAYTEGMSKGDLYDATTGKPKYTKIYANTASTEGVVGNTSGEAVATTVESFANHIKGKGSAAKLFSVAADETKIVTINVWLQYPNIPGYHIPLDIPGDILISNFGIISDLTPRRVTLIPTDRWDLSNTTEYFYAWCWDSSKSGVEDRLYKLELDEYEHYSFQYNGTYQKTLFIRCGNANLTTNDMKSSWSTLGLWNKTADTAIPNTPTDPTYVIHTISGGAHDDDINGNKSTGAWVSPDIVTIKTAYVTGQSSTWGTLRSYSYYGTTVTSSQQVEANNSTSSTAQHHDTIHAVPGKKVRLTATANTDYAFVGWYDNAAGTGTALSTSATYDFNASSEAPKEVVYYAKFKEVRNLTIVKYLDGTATTTATAKDVGTITIGTNTSANDDVTSYSQTYDKGTTVTFSATPSTGYSLTGIYTTATGGNAVTSVTLDDNTTYYARFTTNSYKVKAHAYYTNNNGSSYTANNATGGTVKVGSATAGATSEANVKYKSNVTLTATPTSDYSFIGWFSTDSGGTAISTSATYNYTLSTPGAVEVYGRFKKVKYNVTASVVNTGGTVTAGSGTSGTTSTGKATVNSTIRLVATPSSDYEFDGWYTASSGGTFLSADASYDYTLSSYSDVTVYAKFNVKKTTTIYMTYRGYSKMRVYVYGKSTGREYNGSFPGLTVPTYTGNRGLYSYTFSTAQDEDIGIIVSDNGSESARNEYTAHTGNTCLIGPSGSTINTSFTLGTKRYVYFTKNWTNNYIHYWGASSGNTSWPGYNMNSNKAYTNEYNQDVLYYVITTNHTKVIFHDNSGNQTGDTTLGNNSCFYFNGSSNAAGTWSPPTT